MHSLILLFVLVAVGCIRQRMSFVIHVTAATAKRIFIRVNLHLFLYIIFSQLINKTKSLKFFYQLAKILGVWICISC